MAENLQMCFYIFTLKQYNQEVEQLIFLLLGGINTQMFFNLSEYNYKSHFHNFVGKFGNEFHQQCLLTMDQNTMIQIDYFLLQLHKKLRSLNVSLHYQKFYQTHQTKKSLLKDDKKSYPSYTIEPPTKEMILLIYLRLLALQVQK